MWEGRRRRPGPPAAGGGGRRRRARIGSAGAPPRRAGPARGGKRHRPARGSGDDLRNRGDMAEYTRLRNSLALIRLRNPPVNAIR